MTAYEPLDLDVLAILVMAAATLLMRAGGFWAMAHVRLTPRMLRMLEELPGSIVAASVLPIVAKNGPAALLAIVAALTSMLVRRNELLAVIVGLMVAALARRAGI